ncbi:geranylgeranyl transferase type-1 subunit beta isoform X2 [Parasteatoda tepidariorum]|nr:geranylgeranyl transferase type-1 subunit beta isoform X2 [Parasteatoda tepidariorum]
MAFFAISTLDLLDALDQIESEREKLIEWIYALQVVPTGNETEKIDFGFRGSFTCIAGDDVNSDFCDKANLAMTYTALSTLVILGDDLSRVCRKDILSSLHDLQLSDGSFRPMNLECENDMRYVYCASCICYILQDWSHIDVQKTVQYIKKSRNYDGGIGQGPGLESHGGSTFCAVASLYLMGELEKAFSLTEMNALRRWLVFRQNQGFQGRPNKPEDTCYTFWIGAILKILDSYEFVNVPEVLKFVLSTQDSIVGGMSKWIDDSPDMLHTYLSISGILLFNKNLPPLVHPALNISERAAHSLSHIHKQWMLQS